MLRPDRIPGPFRNPHRKGAARLSASTELGNEPWSYADSSRELDALPFRVIFEEGCQR